MTTVVAVIDDGSFAMRGAIEVLHENDIFDLLGVYRQVDELPPPTHPVVLLVDPFSDSDAGLGQMAHVPKPYAVMIISACTHVGSVRYALQQGVRGFISKDAGAPILVAAVSAVGLGGIYLGIPLEGLLFDNVEEEVDRLVSAQVEGLTPRERDVLIMVAKGLTHKQIGARLSLTKATVDTYVQRVRQKVGSGNKADLTRLAMELGLVSENVNLPAVPLAAESWHQSLGTPFRMTDLHDRQTKRSLTVPELFN